ncbi:MAG: helix-turn-helix domain-containing protein [Desulfobacteraceae bacterium]|nr:helix-turn-helix domain-containing protein [Desulfobacteraceae bacterium]MBC2751663.1 helix-turn-helix domain-containing protein [Desulfobacteraceae bacterium]
MPHITCLVLEGCLFSGTAGLMDAFGIANLWQQAVDGKDAQPLFKSDIVTVDGRTVSAHGGITIQSRRSIADVDQTDVILVPPLLPNVGPPPKRMDAVLAWLVDQHRIQTRVAALCTGTFILAETGLLDGKKATTNWQYARMFRRRYPRVHLQPEKVMTEDAGLICTGAATSFFQLALYLIDHFGSADLARSCAKALLVDPNRASQAPYAILDLPRDHGDAGVLQAQRLMEKDYAAPLVIDEIARQVGISPRHFKRRFKQAIGETPLGYLQRVRIEAAKIKLERSKAPVSEITWQIGYADSSSFCRLFKKTTGLSPRDYRERFSRPQAS